MPYEICRTGVRIVSNHWQILLVLLDVGSFQQGVVVSPIQSRDRGHELFKRHNSLPETPCRTLLTSRRRVSFSQHSTSVLYWRKMVSLSLSKNKIMISYSISVDQSELPTFFHTRHRQRWQWSQQLCGGCGCMVVRQYLRSNWSKWRIPQRSRLCKQRNRLGEWRHYLLCAAYGNENTSS